MDIGEAAWKKAISVEEEIMSIRLNNLAHIMNRLDLVEQLARGLDLRTQIFVERGNRRAVKK